jgi:hypothetical protein
MPTDIVLYLSDSDGLTKLVGIDLDHAVRLHTVLESLPARTDVSRYYPLLNKSA